MSHADLSPFAATGEKLIANGYSALPIAPGDKAPGQYVGGEWRMMREWSKFCGQLPPAFQVRTWVAWPNAGVGIALGRGLIAVDIDLDDVVDSLCAALPPSIVSKKGTKGLTLFFRGDTAKIKSRAFRIDGVGVVDLLSHGRQSVLPPSIHPKTGRPYEWMSFRTLLDIPLAELTEAPDDIADLIAEALRPFGYKADNAFEWDGQVRETESQSTDFFRRLNEDALANLDAWVPKLGLFRSIRQSDGGWRAVPHWRPSSSGQPNNKRKLNLSFDSRGIRDFGDGKSYTPINVVMCACDLGHDLDTAAKWLGEWIGYNFAPMINLVAGPSAPSRAAEQARTAEPPPRVPAAVLGASEPAPEPIAPPRPEPIGSPEPAEPVGNLARALAGLPPIGKAEVATFPTVDRKAERYAKLEALTRVPGLVGDLVDWIEAASRYPSRPLALAAALCAVGTLAGRFYGTPTDLRTNLYIVGLAESGYGKDEARKCLSNLFERHGMDRFLGGSRIMSATGLREQVMHAPSTLYLYDEYGGLMRDIHDRRAGQHTRMIRDFMLEFYSSAASSFKGADYAAGKTPKIMNPNLSIYGVSTPDDFWSAVTSNGLADGFLARQIVLTIEGDLQDPVKPTAEQRKPPKWVVDGCHAILEPKAGTGNLAGATSDGSTAIDPLMIEWGPGAEEEWDRESLAIRRTTRDTPHEFRPVLNRLAENAQKMAAVVAIGVNPERPVLTRELMQWGFALSWLSVETTIDEIKGRLADSDYQRQYLEVRRHIEKAGSHGLSLTELKKKLNGKLETRRFADIIENLKSADDIDVRAFQNPRGGPTGARFVFIPDEGLRKSS